MRKYVLFLMCVLLFAGAAQAGLFQHLDATNAGSITIDNPIKDPNEIIVGYSVGTWKDLSGNGRDATAEFGEVEFPSTLKSAGGFAGLEFGTDMDTMISLNQEDTALLLDPGDRDGDGLPAVPGDPCQGFSVLAAFVPTNFTGGNNELYMLGTQKTGSNFNIAIDDMSPDSRFLLKLDTANYTAEGLVQENESWVVATSWDAKTGIYKRWAQSPDDDVFDQSGQSIQSYDGPSMKLGRAHKDNKFQYVGMIGEIRIWDEALDPCSLAYQMESMSRKWVESRAVKPLDGVEVVAVPDLTLQWKNLLPITEGDDVYVDVYFGTEPNRPQMAKVLNDSPLSSVSVGQIDPCVTYHWAVDTMIGQVYPSDTDPNIIRGPLYSFTAVADPAPQFIEAGPDYITWPGEGVPVEVTIGDAGDADVTVTFSCPDPCVTFDPPTATKVGGGGIPKTSFVLSTTATTSVNAGFEVTATVEDTANPGQTTSDTMYVNVKDNPCVIARQDLGLGIPQDTVLGYPGSGCVIDLEDFADFAAVWLYEYAIDSAIVDPDQPEAPVTGEE